MPKEGILKNTVRACVDRRVVEHVLYLDFGKIFVACNILIIRLRKDSLHKHICGTKAVRKPYWEGSDQRFPAKMEACTEQGFALVKFLFNLFSLCPGTEPIFIMTAESNREDAY